jgi:hypothetical protein
MNLDVFAHALRRATRTTVWLCLGTAVFFYIVLYGSSAFYGRSAPDIPWLRDPPRGMRAVLGGRRTFSTPPDGCPPACPIPSRWPCSPPLP